VLEDTLPWIGGVLLGAALACVGMAGQIVVAGGALLATGGFATATMTLLNANLQEMVPKRGTWSCDEPLHLACRGHAHSGGCSWER
jgi:hypothetical protein